MGVKLPPYFDPAHHAVMADVIRRCGVDYLQFDQLCGERSGCGREARNAGHQAEGRVRRVGGSLIKPVALANVRAFWKLLEGRIPIIGTGGVVQGVDAFEHVLCGASAVQVGTALVEEGAGVFERLERELAAELAMRGKQSLEECRGN